LKYNEKLFKKDFQDNSEDRYLIAVNCVLENKVELFQNECPETEWDKKIQIIENIVDDFMKIRIREKNFMVDDRSIFLICVLASVFGITIIPLTPLCVYLLENSSSAFISSLNNNNLEISEIFSTICVFILLASLPKHFLSFMDLYNSRRFALINQVIFNIGQITILKVLFPSKSKDLRKIFENFKDNLAGKNNKRFSIANGKLEQDFKSIFGDITKVVSQNKLLNSKQKKEIEDQIGHWLFTLIFSSRISIPEICFISEYYKFSEDMDTKSLRKNALFESFTITHLTQSMIYDQTNEMINRIQKYLLRQSNLYENSLINDDSGYQFITISFLTLFAKIVLNISFVYLCWPLIIAACLVISRLNKNKLKKKFEPQRFGDVYEDSDEIAYDYDTDVSVERRN
jgi:hypothetical protein